MEHIKKCTVCSNHTTTYKIHTDCESCVLHEFIIAFQNNILSLIMNESSQNLKISGDGRENNIKM